MADFFLFDIDGDGSFDMGLVDGRDFAAWLFAAKGGTDVAMEELTLAIEKMAEEAGITFPDFYDSPPVDFVFDDGPGEPEETIDGYW